ncbi:hypothetical protein GUJ93_ZPchr0008g13022 [Zizania palustris]|uniref:Glycosyltransferase 2-like domain-containing protein n=1 Tax=Zizania palustris TaxID=103762 RepID=A0A8J5RC89_ZIZPA|nr:hypothetical protein GUJ93_ZPchr0008g13022 [Zizania palustris]
MCVVLDIGRRLERAAVLAVFFEDSNSLDKVPSSWIYDPTEKYISLIIPAYNEEHRLPDALTETLIKALSQEESIGNKGKKWCRNVNVVGKKSLIFSMSSRQRKIDRIEATALVK